jgi:hypothetical protein
MTYQLYCTLRVADTDLSDYGRALWPAASCTAVMALAVVGMRELIDHRVAPPVALAVSIATGAVVYAAALAMLHPRRVGLPAPTDRLATTRPKNRTADRAEAPSAVLTARTN